MATKSLREYNLEISSLIDQGLTDEAVTHCKHILQSYPKYVDTYRLLGKAYLESSHNKEALDVFQRILAVLPDDFLTHAGMSFIREDEGNLPAAVWHMERAFEAQPTNLAIQEELKTLYGKRDGIKPEKLRLTRGALCRMYARGKQFRQAFAEIESILAETPDRLDLEVLLVEMYEKLNLSNEAVSLCKRLLEKNPYCWAANRVLYKISGDDGDRDKNIYHQRLVELDPYESFIDEQHPSAGQVPNEFVAIEKLVEITPEVAIIPEVLAMLEEEVSTPQEETDTPIAEEFAPLVEEFLDLEEETLVLEDTQPTLATGDPIIWVGDISPEIPDWLDEVNIQSNDESVEVSRIDRHEEIHATEDVESAPVGDEVASIDITTEPDLSLYAEETPAFVDETLDEFVTHMALNDFISEEQGPLDIDDAQEEPPGHIPPIPSETDKSIDYITPEATAAVDNVPDWLNKLTANENPLAEELTSPTKQVDDSWQPESIDTELISVEASVSGGSVTDSGEPQMSNDAPHLPGEATENSPSLPDWLSSVADTRIEEGGTNKPDAGSESGSSSISFEEAVVPSITNDIVFEDIPVLEYHETGEVLPEGIPVSTAESPDEEEVELPEWLKQLNIKQDELSETTTPEGFEWIPEADRTPATPSFPIINEIIDTSSPGEDLIEADGNSASPDSSPSTQVAKPDWMLNSGTLEESNTAGNSQNLPSPESSFINFVEHSEYSQNEDLSDTQPTGLTGTPPVNNDDDTKSEDLFADSAMGQLPVESEPMNLSSLDGVIDSTNVLQDEQNDQEPETALDIPTEPVSPDNNLYQAILELTAATNANPGNSELWLQLGDSLRKSGDLPGAIEAYSKAQKLLQ